MISQIRTSCTRTRRARGIAVELSNRLSFLSEPSRNVPSWRHRYLAMEYRELTGITLGRWAMVEGIQTTTSSIGIGNYKDCVHEEGTTSDD